MPEAVVSDALYRSYIPELDGLRAFAILGVLLFHLEVPGFSLGWAGVPLFFVISGFLITRILLNTRDKPYYFRNFYTRRSLRIFPIYYLVLFLYFGAIAVTGPHSRVYAALAGTYGKPFALFPYYLCYLQSIPIVNSGFKVVPLMGHTWSLAVEEQFYWIWPFVVMAVRRERLVFILLLLIATGPIIRAMLWHATTNPYYQTALLPDFLDTIAIGGLVAWLAVSRWRRPVLERLGWASVAAGALIVLLLVARSGPAAYWLPPYWVPQPENVFMFTGMALLFGGIVALCVAGSRAVRWLSSGPLVQVGKVSYGIYLYHVFAFYVVGIVLNKLHKGAAEPMSSWRGVLVILSLAASYAAAVVSWKLIEHPINSLKDRFTRGSAPQREV